MTVTPEDLVQAWHLAVAQEAEPIEWTLPRDLWLAVRKAVAERDDIDAGDHITDEGQRFLLGTPITVTDDALPSLTVRRAGEREVLTITGPIIDG